MPGESVTRVVLCLCVEPAEAATSRVTVTTAEDISEVAQAAVRILPATGAPSGAGAPAAWCPAVADRKARHLAPDRSPRAGWPSKFPSLGIRSRWAKGPPM